MPPSLPPLNALRAFEAAARHTSFAKAAEELYVTPAAISHQVKQLEKQLGILLFHRKARGLELSDAGQQLLPELTRGFGHMERGVGALTAEGISGKLTVRVLPSFATHWLLPRLSRFIDSHPEIQISISALKQKPDVIGKEADIGIFYGMGKYPGLHSQLLMQEEVFPVCSPSLLNKAPLRRFADLANHTLLHDIDTNDDEPAQTWRRWLRDAGLHNVDAELGVKFSNSALLTEAAAHGQGVALGRTALVKEHLQSGRLVRPLKDTKPADYAYHVITTEGNSKKPRIQAFINWLNDECRK